VKASIKTFGLFEKKGAVAEQGEGRVFGRSVGSLFVNLAFCLLTK